MGEGQFCSLKTLKILENNKTASEVQNMRVLFLFCDIRHKSSGLDRQWT